jgi:hypothetical protein
MSHRMRSSFVKVDEAPQEYAVEDEIDEMARRGRDRQPGYGREQDWGRGRPQSRRAAMPQWSQHDDRCAARKAPHADCCTTGPSATVPFNWLTPFFHPLLHRLATDWNPNNQGRDMTLPPA